jgi:hypothetical protein
MYLFTSYNFRKAKCEDFKLTIEPNPQNLFARTDYFGNTQYYFSILKPHKVLQVIATSIVAVFPPKVLVANTITCAEALHLFSTKLVLKMNYYNFNFQVPYFF